MPPVLLLLFNRPDLTRGLVESLRIVRPGELYVAVDGPREGVPGDREKVEEVRKIAEEEIDWPCRKHWLVRSENLGCGVGVSSAISWFFQQVEQGIILEDDCHPDPSFFGFCQAMLERYSDDNRVAMISGTSLLPDGVILERPYYFSKYTGIWGWASWRRMWECYAYDLYGSSAKDWEAIVEKNNPDPLEREYWMHFLHSMLAGEIDTWDFQVQFAKWKSGGLTITPGRNLVENRGFRPDATHTQTDLSIGKRKAASMPGPYPSQPVGQDSEVDRLTFLQRLLISPEFASHLLLKSNERLQQSGAGAEASREDQPPRGPSPAEVAEIKETLEILRGENQTLVQALTAARREMECYYGVTGAWRCLRKLLSP